MVAFCPDKVVVVKAEEAYVVPYSQMLYGAALSAALAAALVVPVGRCRRAPIVLAAAFPRS
jgi:hypothetical protein